MQPYSSSPMYNVPGICEFTKLTKGERCLLCGSPLPITPPKRFTRACPKAKRIEITEKEHGPPKHQCGDVFEPAPELPPGDRFASHLKTQWNITEDKYKSFKHWIGLPPDCNCAKRKDWLNRIPLAYQKGGILAAWREQKAWKKDWEQKEQ